MPFFAALLVGLLLLWLGVNFAKSPSYFFTISFIGLTNGSVYALVALGYTLVYGILELINFAHGDVFMLGGLISGTMIISAFHLGDHRRRGSPSSPILVSLLVAMASCGLLNASDRADRLPAAAQRASARAADHRDRHVVHPPGRRAALEGPCVSVDCRTSCRAATSSRSRACSYTWEKLIVVLITVPVLLALIWLVQRDAAGQGDARDGAGPRCRRDDGHQRQPDDLVHVPDRGRARGCGGAVCTPSTSARCATTRASSSG